MYWVFSMTYGFNPEITHDMVYTRRDEAQAAYAELAHGSGVTCINEIPPYVDRLTDAALWACNDILSDAMCKVEYGSMAYEILEGMADPYGIEANTRGYEKNLPCSACIFWDECDVAYCPDYEDYMLDAAEAQAGM